MRDPARLIRGRLATLLLAGLALTACGSAAPTPRRNPPAAQGAASSPSASPEAAQATPITIAVPAVAEPFTDSFVARDLGIFAKHGLDAKIVEMKPNAALAALSTGSVSFWAGVGSGAKAAETGRPLRGVFLSSDAPGLLLVGAKGVTRIAQVKGGTVATKAALDTNTLTAQLLLSRAGLAASDYRIDYAGTTGAQEALLTKGTVAAAMLELGPALKLQAEGYAIIGDATKIRLFGSGLVASTQAIRDDPDVIRRSVAAMKEAVGLLVSQKPKVLAVMEKEFRDSPGLASRIYDRMKDTWIPSGIPPTEAVQGEIDFDTNALRASHVRLKGPITEGGIFDLRFVQGGSAQDGGPGGGRTAPG